MKQFKHLIKPYIIWASILIVVPLILIVLYAFTSDGNEVLTLHFTWANFAKFLETTYLSVILKSFRLGILTTLICLVCGYPLAGAEFSHPYGYDPHVDQHAPSYLCMDEYSFRQWSGEQPSENAGNFTDHHDVYRFFGYCGPCL